MLLPDVSELLPLQKNITAILSIIRSSASSFTLGNIDSFDKSMAR